MAKKVYHIPLEKSLQFIKINKVELNTLLLDVKLLQYSKELGKSHYHIEIEEFIQFFKIDNSVNSALKTLEYFNSSHFFDEVYKLLNFTQFDLKKSKINQKEFFYAFCYLFIKNNNKLFKLFIQKIFLHYHSTFNTNSNITIDYKQMSQALIKSKKLKLKESFGEDENSSFFKILLNDEIVINEEGKLIKTLRKKAYKNLFYYLIELDDIVNLQRDIAHNRVLDLKDI